MALAAPRRRPSIRRPSASLIAFLNSLNDITRTSGPSKEPLAGTVRNLAGSVSRAAHCNAGYANPLRLVVLWKALSASSSAAGPLFARRQGAEQLDEEVRPGEVGLEPLLESPPLVRIILLGQGLRTGRREDPWRSASRSPSPRSRTGRAAPSSARSVASSSRDAREYGPPGIATLVSNVLLPGLERACTAGRPGRSCSAWGRRAPPADPSRTDKARR